MVRENHKMVREMSGKSQGILWGLMAGHPDGLLNTPYGNIDQGEYGLRWWLVAWRHQAINWTNID